MTFLDSESGAWLLEPEQRPAFYAAKAAGHPYQAAMAIARGDRSYLLPDRAGLETSNDVYVADDPDPHAWWKARIENEKRLYGDPDEAPSPPRTARSASGAPGVVKRAGRAAWKAAKGLAGTNSDNPERPSHTYSGRRQRLLQAKVARGEYATIAEADKGTPRRSREPEQGPPIEVQTNVELEAVAERLMGRDGKPYWQMKVTEKCPSGQWHRYNDKSRTVMKVGQRLGPLTSGCEHYRQVYLTVVEVVEH